MVVGPVLQAWTAEETFLPALPSRTVEPVLPAPMPEMRPAEEHLEDLRQGLQAGSQDAKSLASSPFGFAFPYKGRGCRGGALHVAVQCREGLEVARQLIQLRAEVNAECSYKSLGKTATAQPIHLAVQSGCPEIVEVLLKAGASIDARARRNGEDHFYPLHEAAFFRQEDVASFLLEQGAKVNCINLEGMTPLHVAAKNGAADVVAVLLKHAADIEITDDLRRTALQVAVESGVFPHRRLHLMARWQIEDIMVVAEHCPCAVAGFMRDLCRENNFPIQEVHKSTTVNRLQRSQTLQCSHWIDLMEEAPEGGCLLFDILTVEPDEDNFFYHPLPAQAFVQELQCVYKVDQAWTCDTESGAPRWPHWHDRLAPGDGPQRRNRRRKRPSGRSTESSAKLVFLEPGEGSEILSASFMGLGQKAELNPVHIRQLRMPGVVCPEVFQALAETCHLAIFEREATQSILRYTWISFVRDYYTVQLCHRAIEIAVLVTWTFYETTWERDHELSAWTKRCCWSFILVSSLRETSREISQACGHIIRGDHRSYFGNYWNYLDWAVIIMFNLFSWTSMDTLELNQDPRIFAAVSLFRWLQLLYTLRAYSAGNLGIRSIIPILHSLKEIGGMLIICFFTFIGFTHAFLALDQNPDNWQAIVVDTFRLLFMADGDGIDTILTLGAYNSNTEITVAFGFLVLAVLVFCISLLNLFIAVHGEAYAQANQNSLALHLQERAALCLHCMMQPQWPFPSPIRRCLGPLGRRLPHRKVAYGMVCAVSVPVWMGLLWIQDLHPVVTSFFLLAAVLLGNCFLVQRPWETEEERRKSIMWWCAPVHEGAWQEEVQRNRGVELDEVAKRMGYLELHADDTAKHLAQLEEKIDSLIEMKKKASTTHVVD